MCPIYVYECDDCGATCDVLRQVSEYDTPPDADEATGAVNSKADGCGHKSWHRLIGKLLGVARTDNWIRHGGKGFWVVSLLIPLL